MKITVTAEEPKDNKVAAKLTIPAADVDAAVKKTYKDFAHKYNFQGFRRGHAPRPVIDGILGKESVLAQATNDLLNAAEPLMLEELNIVPVGRPDFAQDADLAKEGQDYTIDVTIGVRYEDVPEGEAAQEGDVVKADIENVEGAEKLAGEGQTLALVDGQVPDEVKQALTGAKVGDVVDIAWTIKHEDGEESHEHSYKAKATVKGIQRPTTPELDDEFAKKSFGYDTVDEFKSAVRDEIAEDKKVNLPNLKEDRVVEAVGERLQLDEVPADYQEEVFNELGQEVLGQMQRSGISLDMYLKARNISPDAFIADLHAQAEERARQSLALDAIARQLGLEATDEDVRNEFEKANVGDVDKAIEQWRSEGRLPAIRDSIKRTKALDWLVENAQVTIVDEAAEAAKESEGEKSEDAE